MKITKLAAVVPGPVRLVGYERDEVNSLCTDSRKVQPGALFFCIPGLRSDAHEFAPQAVEAGAAALVVDHELPVKCPQIIVPDVRSALARMAAAFYGNPARNLRLVGITGTKGKTTTSFLVKAILEKAGHKTGLIGTVCSMIGDEKIPSNLTTPDPVDFQRLLRQMADAGMEYVVMEVSAHAMALRKLEGMCFEVCSFTNLSQDHFDFFGNMENYLAAKMKLFEPDRCKIAVYNADDERVSQAMSRVQIPRVDYGIRVSSDIYAKNIEVGERGCSFQIVFNKRFKLQIDLKLSGIFNVYNAMTAAVMCDALGVPSEAIKAGLESVKGVPGRILDYAHSPDSLENILNTIRGTARARVIAVFGCGGDRDHEKRPIMGEIAGRLADFAVLTSDNPRSEDPYAILAEIEAGIKNTGCPYTVIENRREAIKYAMTHANPSDVVVLAGKGHETYQEIKGVKHPFDEKVVVKELLEEIMAE